MITDEIEVLRILGDVEAVIKDSHIIYASGVHGSCYINKDAIYPHTALIARLCKAIADSFVFQKVDAVIAPAIGGVILSQWTAHRLSELNGHEVLALYAEKDEDGGTFIIKRGYDKLISGKRVLVVEDVLTTGGSVRKVIKATRNAGGEVVGLGTICNRGNVTPEDVGVSKLKSLIDINLKTWEEQMCPLCKEGVPINTDVGHGAEFLARERERV
jgi:orotate phosphoribosyltransferase